MYDLEELWKKGNQGVLALPVSTLRAGVTLPSYAFILTPERFPNLKTMDLRQNPWLTAGQIDSITKKLPGVQVLSDFDIIHPLY